MRETFDHVIRDLALLTNPAILLGVIGLSKMLPAEKLPPRYPARSASA